MEEIKNLKKQMQQHRPAAWDELPDIALYMDQIISYMPRQLMNIRSGEDLTSAMVNNYIKDGLVPRAEGKRYHPEHVGYLTAVCTLKKVLTVRDIGALISAGQAAGKDSRQLYDYFCKELSGALNDVADTFTGEETREDLARIGLTLALNSYANQLACMRILDILAPEERKKSKK